MPAPLTRSATASKNQSSSLEMRRRSPKSSSRIDSGKSPRGNRPRFLAIAERSIKKLTDSPSLKRSDTGKVDPEKEDAASSDDITMVPESQDGFKKGYLTK